MSFPTQADLSFYQAKHCPKWALALRRKSYFGSYDPTKCNIDICINSHANIEHLAGEIAAGNLLNILFSMRKRGDDLVEQLRRIAANPQCMSSPKRRAGFARKWASRME